MITLTVTNQQQYLKQDFTRCFLENSFDVLNYILLNYIELGDLENLVNTEFAQGLPSDIEFNSL